MLLWHHHVGQHVREGIGHGVVGIYWDRVVGIADWEPHGIVLRHHCKVAWCESGLWYLTGRFSNNPAFTQVLGQPGCDTVTRLSWNSVASISQNIIAGISIDIVNGSTNIIVLTKKLVLGATVIRLGSLVVSDWSRTRVNNRKGRLLDRLVWFGSCVKAVCEGNCFAKKLPVSLCDSSGTINTDEVAIVGPNFNDNSSFLPLARICSSLVLDTDQIIRLERGKFLGASR